MIEQKDIDRLLAGRKIVDEIQRIDVDILQQKLAEIKPDRLSAVTKADIVTKKEDVDALYEAEKQSILTAEKKLTDLGFSGIGEFLDFNKSMVLAEYKDMVDIFFLGCKGCPTIKCVQRFGENTCGNRPDTKVTDAIYLFFLSESLRSQEGTKTNFSDIERTCPDGYGFQWKRSRDERFDLGWRWQR